MRVSTYVRVHTTMNLERGERFKSWTKDSRTFPFMVNQITWDGSEHVSLSGPALKADFTEGLVNRSGWMKFDDLTPEWRASLHESHNDAIEAHKKGVVTND